MYQNTLNPDREKKKDVNHIEENVHNFVEKEILAISQNVFDQSKDQQVLK